MPEVCAFHGLASILRVVGVWNVSAVGTTLESFTHKHLLVKADFGGVGTIYHMETGSPMKCSGYTSTTIPTKDSIW